jgi:RNA polymerase sigma-70 factor (ECF subfamily)
MAHEGAIRVAVRNPRTAETRDGDRPAGAASGFGPGVNESDQALVARCRAGEGDAFGELVERYQQRLVRYARGLVGNEEDARDVAQEAFVRAFVHLARYDEGRSFSVWLYGITSHVAVDWLRSRARRSNLEQRLPEPRPSLSPEELAVRGDSAARIQEAVRHLPLDYRQMVLLHYGEELTCAEAARVLGISHGAARVRLFRARELLRQRLGPLVEGGPLAEKVEE